MLTDAAALVLAGGKSSRMGTDKVQLELTAGETLLDRAVGFWQALCGVVYAAVGTPEHLSDAPGVPVYDARPGCGPMAGLEAGLQACEQPLLFVCAADMPALSAARAMELYAAIGGADACVFRLDGRPEPLFGLYRRSCLPVVQRLLESGQYRLRALLDAVDTVYLDTEDDAAFRNLNTPAEFARARQQLAAGQTET